MNSPITVNWRSLVCYGIAGAFSVQSILSIKRGLASFASSFCGSTPLNNRIKLAKENNLFTGLKIACIGNDSLAERISLLTNGLENLVIGGVCGLIAFIVFQKGTLATANTPHITPPPPEEFSWKEQAQAFEELYYNQSMASINQKKHLQFSEFGRKYVKDPECASLLAQAPSEPVPFALARKIYDCIFDHFLADIYNKKYSNSPELTAFFNDIQNPAAGISMSSSASLSLASPSEAPSPAPEEAKKIKAVLVEFTDSYLPSLYQQNLQELLDNQFYPLKQISEKRLAYYKDAQMKKRFGPFEIHLDQICDQGYLSNHSLAYQLEAKLCDEYREHQSQLALIQACEKKLNTLSPQFHRTNGRDEVFEPAINQVINDYLTHRDVPGYAEKHWSLPTELLEFFIAQRPNFIASSTQCTFRRNYKCLS